jgi:hypothetical protein
VDDGLNAPSELVFFAFVFVSRVTGLLIGATDLVEVTPGALPIASAHERIFGDGVKDFDRDIDGGFLRLVFVG